MPVFTSHQCSVIGSPSTHLKRPPIATQSPGSMTQGCTISSSQPVTGHALTLPSFEFPFFPPHFSPRLFSETSLPQSAQSPKCPHGTIHTSLSSILHRKQSRDTGHCGGSVESPFLCCPFLVNAIWRWVTQCRFVIVSGVATPKTCW